MFTVSSASVPASISLSPKATMRCRSRHCSVARDAGMVVLAAWAAALAPIACQGSATVVVPPGESLGRASGTSEVMEGNAEVASAEAKVSNVTNLASISDAVDTARTKPVAVLAGEETKEEEPPSQQAEGDPYEVAIFKNLVVREVTMEIPFKPLGSTVIMSCLVSGMGISMDKPGMTAGGLSFAAVMFVAYSWILHATGYWLEACGLYATVALVLFGLIVFNKFTRGPAVDRTNLEPYTYEWVRNEVFLLNERPDSSFAALGLAIFMLICVIWSCISLSLESMASFNPKVNPEYFDFFDQNETIVTLIFTAEYVARLWAAFDRIKFAKKFMNVMDLASVAPFWLTPVTGIHVSLQAVRVIRILKVFRLLKLARFSETLTVIVKALKKSGDGLMFLSVFVAIGMFLISAMFWMVEDKVYDPDLNCWKLVLGDVPESDCLGYQSVPDCFYYALTTMTTVGYGDVLPASNRTRVVACMGMVMGVLVLAMPVGILATEFQSTYEEVKRDSRIKGAKAIGPRAFQVVQDMYNLQAEAGDCVMAAHALIINELQESDPDYVNTMDYVVQGLDGDISTNLEQALELLHRLIPQPTEDELAAKEGDPEKSVAQIRASIRAEASRQSMVAGATGTSTNKKDGEIELQRLQP
eukprot:TRINITY_DN68928_c0_g1_i1.p1 TRINITY_DN68928_c0_g1~~TRINITY_DN68928_c0_g1_i1.p1  ORF type:complete len:643 (+),score=108.34 TRINITY_DN68928_c0_g1_i1:110-2038(+)